jgi:hypothetical protein
VPGTLLFLGLIASLAMAKSDAEQVSDKPKEVHAAVREEH